MSKVRQVISYLANRRGLPDEEDTLATPPHVWAEPDPRYRDLWAAYADDRRRVPAPVVKRPKAP